MRRDLVSFAAPVVTDLADPATKDYLEQSNANLSQQFRELELTLAGMLNEDHAPFMIPRVTIDPASNIAAANGAGYSGLQLPNTVTTASTSLATILSYTGRGVVQKLVVAEKDNGGAVANNMRLKITVDGIVLLDTAAFITNDSQIRAAVGSLNWVSASQMSLDDDSLGLPFNKTLLIQASTASGAHTCTVGYKVAKKL